jgi:membrane protein implicated in regulation of membrane protease activity
MMDILFGDLAPWFTAPALLGTGFLLIQLILGELGGDGGLDLDLDIDIDTDLHADHPGAEFGLLSIQSLSAFFLGYGWIGLAAYRFLDIGFTGSALIAVGAGAGVAWLMVYLLRTFLKLQNNTNVSINEAVGLVGEVYATVPPAGEGKGEIILVINQSQHNYFATQESEDPIPTHTRVRVVRADTASNLIVVEPTI